MHLKTVLFLFCLSFFPEMLCSICSRSFLASTNKEEFLKHMRTHRNTRNAKYQCILHNCQAVYYNFNSFKSHLRRKHTHPFACGFETTTVSNIQLSVTLPLRCSVALCKKLCDSYEDLVKHMKVHIRQGINVQCPYVNCSASYSVVSSFSSHISRNHCSSTRSIEYGTSGISIHSLHSCDGESVMKDNNVLNCTSHERNAVSSVNPVQQHNDDPVCSTLEKFALFLLKLESICFVPKRTIRCIVDEISCLDNVRNELLRKNLSRILVDAAVSNDIVADVFDAINIASLNAVSNKLQSIHRRSTFFKNNFKFISLVTLNLGMHKGKKCCFEYVSLCQSVQTVAKEAGEHFIFNCNHDADTLCDIFNGDVFKSKHNPHYLQLLLYQDSFEIVNPLGSSRKKHKLLAVYAVIGNLPPSYRTFLDNLILVLLVKETYIKVFGQKVVFRLLLNDLKKLESEGIEYNGKKLKCQLLSFLGDNLGCHMIGGFSESFSCHYFCRYCLVTKAIFNDVPYEVGQLRDELHYSSALQCLKEQHSEMVQGIKFDSVFNELQSYHVCKPGLPPCLGHDLLEGIVAVDMALYINYFVGIKWFTYDLLNNRILHFPYFDYDAASKPPPVPANAIKLIGQAMENRCLLRLFPLIVFDFVACKTDRVWLLLLQLREIVELARAPTISKTHVGYLDATVKDYLHNRNDHFPHKNLIPKHHFLAH